MIRIILVISVMIMFGAFTPVQAETRSAEAEVHNTEGEKVGTLTLVQESDMVKITMEGSNLPPGFHGFHIHEVGECEPPFSSAGDHYNPEGVDHPEHAGDLPNLLVNVDGSAFMVVKTDRFSLNELLEGDGSALIIHSEPDNFANIPQRYTQELDEQTLGTGDAGDRIACGVIEGK